MVAAVIVIIAAQAEREEATPGGQNFLRKHEHEHLEPCRSKEPNLLCADEDENTNRYCKLIRQNLK